MAVTDYLKFDLIPQEKLGRKTKTWNVRSRHGNRSLGVVQWWTHWRRYTFSPDGPQVVLDPACLRALADFCEEQTRVHRANRGRL